jgi:hypothetical protein
LQPSNDSGVSPDDSFTNVAGDTGHANDIADSSPVGGELTPATPVPIERATTRKAGKRKPSQRVRHIMSSFIKTLDDEDDPDVEDDEVLCKAIENCIDPPNYSAAMKTAAAERWQTAITRRIKEPSRQPHLGCRKAAGCEAIGLPFCVQVKARLKRSRRTLQGTIGCTR